MSEKNIPEQLKQDAASKQTTAALLSQPARRRLLKSTVAIPVIMTLHSGAALARTSNLVGAVTDLDSAAKKMNDLEQARIVCVNPGDGPIEESSSTYDLGMNPTAALGDASQDLATQAENCQTGGGILISVTAFQSLQGRGFFSDL
ncbi:hypothetical protein [Nitrosomonas eutropha]|uniref:Uncharacterized protein n=2 Tax=Nitrosomonas eutropha TaxID=916 RepID=A0ABX5M8U5_9PROT|nr:hypothetical protein [Nitrosomonas eutropha]ABI58756.1 conserved hypothetical protein [Nitrosomonas eutropha C91]PXV80673.1 hypothetical protein C8R14_1146 [Nitrosomonas eutropha]